MVEPLGLAERHLGAVHDRGVIQFVDEDHLAPADECGDEPEVGLVSCGEHQRRFLAEELRETRLELLVQIECSIQKPAARAA